MTPEIKQRIQQIRQGKNNGIQYVRITDMDLDIIDGDRGKNYPHGDELLSNGYCLFLSAENVTKTGFRFDNNQFITKEKDYALRNGRMVRDDIVITTRGSIGHVAYYDDKVPFDRIRINSGMLIIRNKKEQINMKYLYQVLAGDWFQKQILLTQTGSAQPQFPKSIFSKMKLPLPPLPEQTAIAEILSTQDRVIELKEQLLAEKKRQKKYLMQQLLTGKMRLKGFKGEWKKCRLGEVAKFSKGYGYSKSDISINGEIPIILYGRLYTNYKTIIKDIDTYTNTKIRNAVFSKGNEVIVPASGETAEDIAIASCIEPEGVILGGDLNIIYPNETILPSYLANLISYGPLHLELSKKAQGKSVVHLHNDDLSNVIIEFPPLPEQTAIAEILSTADREIELIGQSIEVEKRKKKSLMQLLLTGIVRVP